MSDGAAPVTRPRVSVIIPAFSGKYLRDCVESVVAAFAAYPPAEILLRNDGSTEPGLDALLDALATEHPGRIRVFHATESLGVAQARNELIAHSVGDYIVSFDHDDLMLPFDVRGVVDFMDAHPEYAVSYTIKYRFSDERGYLGEINGGPYARFSRFHNTSANLNAAFLRRGPLLEVGGFQNVRGDRKVGLDDLVLFMRLAEKYDFYCDPDPRTLYRVHERQLSDACPTWDDWIMDDVISRHAELFARIERGDLSDLHGPDRLLVCGLMGAACYRHRGEPAVWRPLMAVALREFPDDFGLVDDYMGVMCNARDFERLDRYAEESLTRFAERPPLLEVVLRDWMMAYQLRGLPPPEAIVSRYRAVHAQIAALPPKAEQILEKVKSGNFKNSKEKSMETSGMNEEVKTNNSSAQPETYARAPEEPVFEAVDGIRYDFNYGLRIKFPANGKRYRVFFEDADTKAVIFNSEVPAEGGFVMSVKKYYIRFHFAIYESGVEQPIFEHTLELKDREVMVQLPVSTLGDSIAWFSYMERFQQKRGCRLTCVVMPFLRDLVAKQYPEIRFVTKEEARALKPYATYLLGLFFKGDVNFQPIDFRQAGLHRTAGYILGMEDVEMADIPPRFDLSAPRRIKEKYVVIAAKSSTQCKFWNNPFGWDGVIRFLKEQGYRVICIDKDRVAGNGLQWNLLPWGVEDETGAKPLQERINLIKDADAFIGLSSGLAWLAWGCKVPVVLISGFTLPMNEFYTPYRIINYQVCNGCWNDTRCEFDHKDFMWCPRHKGDERQFECMRSITPDAVIAAIKKIPGFSQLTV